MSDNVNGRQRLKPWLESKIESGKIPGLNWLDRSQKIFRIPWKRNGTTEWEKEDSAIFRDWAIHTGKFREGIDKIDYPYWKTRLRCALSKHPEIIECKEENRSNGQDPYRVYRILDNSTCDEPLPTQAGDVEMVDISQDEEANIECASMGSDLKNISSSQIFKMTSEVYKHLKDLEFGNSDFDFEVTIHFQSRQILKTFVKDCCLLTKNDTEMQMPTYCQVISFPDLDKKESVPDITSVLWPNLNGGIYIKFDDNKNIIAKRLCKCRIYYRDQHNQNELKLNRSNDYWTKIFDYGKFLNDYKKCPPSADTVLYIGQRADPDPNKVFFSVDICHLEAKQHLIYRYIPMHKVSLSI